MAQANAAWVYATGPVHMYCRISTRGPNPQQPAGDGSGTISYVGTSEDAPEFDRSKKFGEVHTAQGGNLVPYDMGYGGQIITVGMDLKRHSDTILRLLEDAPNFGRIAKNQDGGPDGLELVGDIGALIVSQGLGIEFWMLNTFWKYAQRNLFAYPDLRPGYYFRSGIPLRLFRGDDGKVEASKARLDLLMLRVYDPVSMSFYQYDSISNRFAGAALPDPG